MPQCPQCTKTLGELARECPYCKADLDLLVEYVAGLQTGLERAEGLTRAGELDQAVWAYLSVLEVDPDNATARRQVGRVATAVRQFDRTAPGRRWLARIRGEDFDESTAGLVARGVRVALVAVLVGLAFALGYAWGSRTGEGGPAPPNPTPSLVEPQTNTLGN
jgi:hypothetical protein